MTAPRCYIELDQSAFTHNLNRVRGLTPNAKIMAVIKADGYGHGMELAATALQGADEFAVTNLEDAQRLRRQGITKPLTVLSAQLDIEQLYFFAANRVRPVIYDYHQLEAITSLSTENSLDVWLKVDTGMGRLGFHADEIGSIYQRLISAPAVGSISLMTHLANADEPSRNENTRQFECFEKLLNQASPNSIEFKDISVLNSAGVVAFADYAYDWVRPGLMLYGISPQPGLSSSKLGLKPVMSLLSSVISVRMMPSGSSIGYGSTYTLETDSRIAYIGCGYGDGYPRHAKNGTSVFLNGFFVPLVGRVSMDIIALDIGELPVRVGDKVELWGKNNPIEIVAESAGTIAYELTCGVTSRVARIEV